MASSIWFWETKHSHRGLDQENMKGVGWLSCCCFEGGVHRWIVTVQQPILYFHNSDLFSSDIFFSSAKNIKIKVRILHNTSWNEFSVIIGFDGKEHVEYTLSSASDLLCILHSRWHWALPMWWLLFCLWIVVIKLTFTSGYGPREERRIVVRHVMKLMAHINIMLLLIKWQEVRDKLCSNKMQIFS